MMFRLLSFAIALMIPWSAQTNLQPTHEKLRVRNTFQNPEDVVRYYCSRDASGFVWSGLLEIERRAFTLWQAVPEREMMFVARSFQVAAAKREGDRAWVDVEYDLVGMADIHGTFQPVARPPKRKVTFELRKSGTAWKIASPDAGEITPVVVDRLFPVLKGNS